MLHPDAIDEDARGQRVVRIGNRLGQIEPAAAIAGNGLRFVTGHDFEELPRHVRTAIAGIAAQKDVRRTGGVGVGQGHRARRRGRGVRLKLIDFFFRPRSLSRSARFSTCRTFREAFAGLVPGGNHSQRSRIQSWQRAATVRFGHVSCFNFERGLRSAFSFWILASSAWASRSTANPSAR